METTKQLMVGGNALVALGSSRKTLDTDYLVCDTTSKLAFIHDTANNVDYINANGNAFFAQIWAMEKNNMGPLASPQALLELKAYAFAQHCQNRFFQKADNDEYDIQYLIRQFNLTGVKLVKKHVSAGAMVEIQKVIDNVRK